ncbi:AraC family transcriptional regulator [Alicyclobacillus sp. SO9]|uniref:helix-turn-helix transcriptional regulator n=1 Tax=Alicyclobacillus sp. SO9 TaxID=2665646 RepID=UPI0018E7FBA3|nr:AraC family transcriptional regulator [Alicyclobacillus sp. SO9]QQE77919.1 helix-turn-helix transcriptional regulator [Alicyclobacillus sp. SO9]
MVFFEHHGMRERDSFVYFTLVNESFHLHFHRAFELIIVNEGELFVTIDQKEYVLCANQLAFIFSNQLHEFRTVRHSNITVVIFSPELIGHFFMNYKGYVPENNVLHLSQPLDFDGLDSIYKQKSFLYDICSSLVRHTPFHPVEYSTKTKVLQKTLLFIDKHYMYNCTLKTVAKHLRYDYAYLSKLFVQLTNMTFTEYIINYRISQACYLLKTSQQSISDIAMNCGYNNLRSFNRNFKRVTHHSPRRYRELSL